MRNRSICVLLTCLIFVPCYWLAQASDADAGPPKPAILKFKLYRGYLIVTHGTIANLEDLNLLIDTGADPSVVDRRIAEKLHSKLNVVGMTTIKGKVPAWQTTLPSFEIGPISSRDVRVLVQDLSFLEKGLGIRIDGLIGLDLLRHNSFTVDYRSEHIRFGGNAFTGPGLDFGHDPNFVTIGMTLDGRPVRLLVDTGASSLMLFRSHWPTDLLMAQNGMRHSTNLAGEFTRRSFELKAVMLGEAKLGRQTAFLVEDQEDRERQFDGLFSPSALGLTEISFDFEHGKVGWNK
jgi:aspartyl protease